MAMAILTSRPNSHPFEERKILLTEPSKVGRSVAKSRPAPNNCIFDCKVLSRNHAIIWFENEKFFLRDTKSSNGTFVNNVRLSKGSEESEPKQLNSGDIIQFGVDVVENSKKVTHGCIIANITLYLPDGSEATRSPSSRSLYKVSENGIPTQDIWQLSQYLQDALYREQMLENRLTALQRLITSSQMILDDNSQKFAQEDKLLSRLEMLENQVEALTRNLSEDDIKRKLLTLQEDRHNYEMRSKETLKRMLQEKLEAVQKLSDAERSCSNAEDECLHYKTLYDKSQMEMRELNERHSQRLEEMQSLQEQVEKAERRHAAVDEQASKERKDFESNLKEAKEKEAAFAARAESLQAECDAAKQQLVGMKAQLDKRREVVIKANSSSRKEDSEEVNDKPISELTIRQGIQLGDEPSLFEDIPVSPNGSLDQSSSDDLKILQAQIKRLEDEVFEKEKHVDTLKENLTDTQELLRESRKDIERLNDKLSKAEQEIDEDKLKISNLEEQVMEYHLQAVDQLTFTDGQDDLDQQEENGEMDGPTPSPSKESSVSITRLQDLLDKILEVNKRVKERRKTLLNWTGSEDTRKPVPNETLVNSYIDNEEESPEECSTVNHGLDFIQKIQDNFLEIERLVDSEHEDGGQIKEEFKNAQVYTKDFKQQILELQDKLLEEQEVTRQKDEYLASLRREINELSHERDLMQVEKNCEHQAFETAQNAAREMQKQAAKSAESAGKNKVELSVISDDNLLLKQKVQTLESELKKYRRENTRLTADYSKLQGSYRELDLQDRALHEKHIKHQANDAGAELKSSEEARKLQEEEWRKNIELEKERVGKLQSYLLSVLALVFAMVLAYYLDLISISPGGRFGSS